MTQLQSAKLVEQSISSHAYRRTRLNHTARKSRLGRGNRCCASCSTCWSRCGKNWSGADGHIAARCADLCPNFSPPDSFSTAPGRPRQLVCSIRCGTRVADSSRCTTPRAATQHALKYVASPDCLPGTHPVPYLEEKAAPRPLRTKHVPLSDVEFEHDPASALSLAHNTNLGSFPALQQLDGPGLRGSRYERHR